MDRVVTAHRLGDLAEIAAGFSPYGRSPAGRGFGEVRLIGTKDIYDGAVDLGELERVTVPDAAKLAPYQVADGDVLVVIRGGAFRAAVCSGRIVEGVIAGGNVAIIRLKPTTSLGPHLLQSMLSAPPGQAALRGLAQGSATLAIRPAMLAGLEICLPAPPETRRLEDLCCTFSHLRAAARAALIAREQVVGEIVGKYVGAS